MDEIRATLSFHMDSKSNMKHDLRQIYVPYVDVDRSKNNVYYSKNTTLEAAYEDLFADAVAEYNARQTRPERRIDNYLQKLLDAEERQNQLIQEKRSAGCSYKELAKYKKSIHPSMQFIVTIGNMQDNLNLIAKDGNDADRAKAVLEEYMNSFQERNPNCRLVCGALHGDEVSVWHGHFTICWFADDCPKGMKRQVSQKRALEAMGFVSDTEKGEDGKLHLAIEKWQNRERAVLRDICKKHGIEICAGNGSKEHLDRTHYIIKKQLEENQKRAEEIKKEYDDLIADVNEQAGFVLSQREQVEEQLADIKDFLENTSQGRQYTVFSQIEEIHEKADAHDKMQAQQKDLLAQFWDSYKSENTAYWEKYRADKQELYKLLQDARQGKRYNDKLLKQYLYALSDRSENLLLKLFSLIAVISLILRKKHLESELAKVEKEYAEFKQNARLVLQASKDTSIALKSKDFENIALAMDNWHMALNGINQNLNAVQNEIEQTGYER
jgi:hypothetical protein